MAPVPRKTSDRPPPDEGWNDTTVTTEFKPQNRLTEDMRSEVRAISRVAIEEAVAPLLKEIRDLTSALEKERRERVEGDARSVQSATAAAAAAKKTTLPGVAEAPATASLVAAPTPPPPSVVASSTPAPSVAAELVLTPTTPRVAPKSTPPPAAPVIVMPRAPDIDLDAGPLQVDLPGMLDGSRRRRRNAWLISFFLAALVGGLLIAMAVSQNQPR